MNCPECKGNDVRRAARRGLLDNLWASLGRWPYYCSDCGCRFRAARRYPPAQPKHTPTPQWGKPSPGPEMVFRRDDVRPTAQVVIQADDHAQLDRILLALHSAVSSYQNAGARPAAKAGK